MTWSPIVDLADNNAILPRNRVVGLPELPYLAAQYLDPGFPSVHVEDLGIAHDQVLCLLGTENEGTLCGVELHWPHFMNRINHISSSILLGLMCANLVAGARRVMASYTND